MLLVLWLVISKRMQSYKMVITNAKYFQGININKDDGSVSPDGVNQGVVTSIDGVTMHVPLDPANIPVSYTHLTLPTKA